MNPVVASRLVELNRAFYEQFGHSFSETRGRLQPGTVRILSGLRGEESVLDLGCGNGGVAKELKRRGHRGRYLGIDFSLPMLQHARAGLDDFPGIFLQLDLAHFSMIAGGLPISGFWDVITCFAVLHHIPGSELRLAILHSAKSLLAGEGRLLISNWQFLNSSRLKSRIQPWEQAGFSASDVEPGDYLLDWRRGGLGMRYAHHFTLDELAHLANQSGFEVIDSFFSDGEGGKLGLYQVWRS